MRCVRARVIFVPDSIESSTLDANGWVGHKFGLSIRLLTYMRLRMAIWFASGMANADAYDWCVDSYVVLVRVHSSPSRQ